MVLASYCLCQSTPATFEPLRTSTQCLHSPEIMNQSNTECKAQSSKSDQHLVFATQEITLFIIYYYCLINCVSTTIPTMIL